MDKKAFGSHYIAGLCQVTRHTVVRWIEQGKLPSFVTGGGQRRVWASNLVPFLKEHNIPVPQELLSVIAPRRFLIVDDEKHPRWLISRILKKRYPEAEIYEAEDGFEAGHKTALLMPSVVFLDLMLPGINGVKVCQMIRRQENSQSIKIIAMSGHNAEEAEKEALRAGADDFIKKPFHVAELVGKLEKLIPSGSVDLMD